MRYKRLSVSSNIKGKPTTKGYMMNPKLHQHHYVVLICSLETFVMEMNKFYK